MTETEKSSALQELYRDYVNRVETRMTWNEFFNGVEKLFSKTPESVQPQNEEKQEEKQEEENKPVYLLTKVIRFFKKELILSDDELEELCVSTMEIKNTHSEMDEKTFNTKMKSVCEYIANGIIKKAVVDGLTDYLKK